MDPIKISEPTGQTPATHGHHKGAKAAAAGVFDRIFSQLGQTASPTLALAVPVAANAQIQTTAEAEGGEPDILAMLRQQIETSQSVAEGAVTEEAAGEAVVAEEAATEDNAAGDEAPTAEVTETLTEGETTDTDIAELTEGDTEVTPDETTDETLVATDATPSVKPDQPQQQSVVAAAVQPAVQAMQQAKAPTNAGGVSEVATAAARQVAGANQLRANGPQTDKAGDKLADKVTDKTGAKSEFKLDGNTTDAPQRGVKTARSHTAQPAFQMTERVKTEATVKQDAAPLTAQSQPAQPANTQAQPLINDTAQFDMPTDNSITEQQQAIDTTDAAWIDNLADRIEATFADNGTEADIALTPDNLGSLRIKIEMTDAGAQVTVVAENAEAAKLFTQTEHRLGELLSRAGLQLSGQQAGTDARGDQQAQQSRGGSDTRMNSGRDGADADNTSATAADGSGLVNLIA